MSPLFTVVLQQFYYSVPRIVDICSIQPYVTFVVVDTLQTNALSMGMHVTDTILGNMDLPIHLLTSVGFDCYFLQIYIKVYTSSCVNIVKVLTVVIHYKFYQNYTTFQSNQTIFKCANLDQSSTELVKISVVQIQ